MDCPMRVGSAGYIYECKKEKCAWWNEKREECAIKTFMCNSKNKTTTTATIARGDWRKDI